ncbi:pimeloyl-ACP methyl ester carboxylesterase [Crossiella equi]|uniref:Pimeloyl-ACP methyl ester carboxylesterase n=1 Tax=Crossiella equi TaxID=130796 RepID=A0ABS5AS69_9PSEU|nr:alpha/beta hydrolase [Crossiella equi]MBP2478540.1 pimeloyl-ACP methyl ester carboxylesterase [Crossiella equi]
MLTTAEVQEIDRANESGLPPVVFVHGLWLLRGSWDRWRTLFAEHGYAPVAPGWPDDPETVAEATANPGVFAGKGVGAVTAHYREAIGRLRREPVVVGHSFGGLITQKLAGLGLARASVAIDPGPFRGVLPLPLSSLRAAFPVLGNPLNRGRSVRLSLAQFRYAFANAVPEEEAERLYREYHVPGSGIPLFQAATANVWPWAETAVDTRNPERGPLLIISGEHDNTVPWAIANASYRKQRRNPSVTEIVEIPGRGHSLVIDSGWREVAERALAFLREHDPDRAGNRL